MKSLLKLFLLLAGVCSTQIAYGQTPKQVKQAAKESALKNKIESKNYTFVANYALPMRGGQRYLTSEYDLRVVNDSVIAYLPYFGRVYSDVPVSSTDDGIKFTSTNFDYKKDKKKNGSWYITITPKDVRRTSKVTLNVSASGNASLVVTSNNRDAITFTGYIKDEEKEK